MLPEILQWLTDNRVVVAVVGGGVAVLCLLWMAKTAPLPPDESTNDRG